MTSHSSTAPAPTFPLRRVVLYVVIGSFAIAALMGIAALLTGGAFGETEGKILLTTLATGLSALAVLCCLATFDSRTSRWGPSAPSRRWCPSGSRST